MHLRNEEGFGAISHSEEVKDEESGGGDENQNPSCDMANPQITRHGGREEFRQQADRTALPPPQKSNSPQGYSASVYICYQVSFICSLNNKIHAGEGEEGRLNAF